MKSLTAHNHLSARTVGASSLACAIKAPDSFLEPKSTRDANRPENVPADASSSGNLNDASGDGNMRERMTHRILESALQRRTALLEDSSTNAFRILDEAGDGVPGITLDQLGPAWLVSSKDGRVPTWLKTPRPGIRTLYAKHLSQTSKRSPTWIWGDSLDESFHILETGIRFELSLQAGYSQGIFLDQRENRRILRERVQPGQRILNTFSYTCAFSVVAALAGATTTSLDLSNPYLSWGKRNFVANNLDPDEQFFCKGDALSWMKRFAKQGREFDGVILDPPTFSRSREGTFQVQRDYPKLVEAAAQIATPRGWILATCNDRGLSHQQFEAMVWTGVSSRGRRDFELTPTDMPPDFTGIPYLKSIWIDFKAP